MTRLLIFVVLVVGVLWWLFGRKRTDADERQDAPPAAPRRSSAKTPPAPAQIVACAHCGVHLPRDEAVADPQGQLFCGEDHRLAGPR